MDYYSFTIEIKKMCNIDLSNYKEKQMKRRIESLIRRSGHETYDGYLELLKKSKQHLNEFLNYITINVSEFFRNPAQWEVLEREILPELLKHKKRLKVWSSACSTGEEPYSLAMLFDKMMIKKTIYNVLVNEEPIEENIIETEYENLYILPSNIQLAGAEVELVPAISREHKLKNAIEGIRDKYDFIIIDCPPSLGLLTLNALTAADTVLVPIQCEYYALEGLGQLLSTISLVQKYLNKSIEVEGVLLTMFDARTNLSMQVVEEVKKHFKSKVYKTIIPRNVRLSEAPSHGKPIISYDSKSKGSEVYMELAKEVLGIE